LTWKNQHRVIFKPEPLPRRDRCSALLLTTREYPHQECRARECRRFHCRRKSSVGSVAAAGSRVAGVAVLSNKIEKKFKGTNIKYCKARLTTYYFRRTP